MPESLSADCLTRHDDQGALDEIQGLLAKHGFEMTAEQDPQLKGTALFTVFASRRR